MFVWQILPESMMITAFVAVMMISIEYLNVSTQGILMRALGHSRWRQYGLAVLLGATPGCLGAFALIALHVHGRITLGAVVAGMIATSGDEAFVMLAMFPRTAVLIAAGLLALGLFAGWITDLVVSRNPNAEPKQRCSFDVHEMDSCRCFPRGELLAQWRPPTVHRAVVWLGLAVLGLAFVTGALGPDVWDWRRVTLVAATSFGLFVVSTVPDHFLEEHVWRHVAMKHGPLILLWTFGALAAMNLLGRVIDVEAVVAANMWSVLVIAGLIGLIPESGPHLIFVMLFAQGTVPLSVLVASSAVQDGHGALPLLAHSRRDFLHVKLVNLLFGLAAGAALMAIGM